MARNRNVVAIIDDDPGMREALERSLSMEGYEAELFSSAKEFIRVAGTTESACLVVDIQLGDMSGVELCHVLSALGHHFPVIFMSGSYDPIAYQQAVDVGHVAFLHKPFPTEQLIECVVRACKARKGRACFPPRSGTPEFNSE